jgi:hypothetical protein
LGKNWQGKAGGQRYQDSLGRIFILLSGQLGFFVWDLLRDFSKSAVTAGTGGKENALG